MRPLAELVLPAVRWREGRGFEPERPRIEEALAAGVGGFILFGGDRDAVQRLTTELRSGSAHALLIAADLERGAGQQVSGLHQLPPPLALAHAQVEDRRAVIREAAMTTAHEARLVGINWVLAPVLDLDVEPANPIVQTRSFGADPELVAECGASWIEGCQALGVLACAKHFPGHGRTTADSHVELPVVSADRASLAADLWPFRRAAELGVASIMTAHVAYPAFDSSQAPATYSRPVLEQLLRREMGYEGLLVTDALIMEGARAGVSEGEGAVRAIAAGCDLLLYPRNTGAVVAALEGAVASGALASSRVEEARERRQAAVRAASAAVLGRGEAAAGRLEEQARELVARSLRVLRGALQPVRGPVAVETVDDDAGGPYPLPPRTAFAEELAGHGVALESQGERVVLLFADVKGWKGRSRLSDVSRQQLAALVSRPATVVLFGHPRQLAEIPGDGPVLCAWSGDVVMQRAAARRLLAG